MCEVITHNAEQLTAVTNRVDELINRVEELEQVIAKPALSPQGKQPKLVEEVIIFRGLPQIVLVLQ